VSTTDDPIRETVGLLVRDDLQLFRMWGRDPVRMLNGLITNDLTRASDQRAVYAAMLTPKGKMLSDLRAFTRSSESGTEVFLAVPTAAADTVEAQLRKFVPPLFSRWERTTLRAIGLYGPRSTVALQGEFERETEIDNHEDAVTYLVSGGIGAFAIATAEAGGQPGYDVFVAAEEFDVVRQRLLDAASRQEGREIDPADYEVARIEAGRPRFGADMTDATLPAEAFESTGLMERAVSFNKGCYTGQEVVVRIAHRGHVNRQIRGILLGEGPVPEPGTMIVRPDTAKEVGAITSVAASRRIGRTIALAMLRKEVDPGDEVVVGGVAATVTELPFSVP
jgi:folate-binding protein YgfZ